MGTAIMGPKRSGMGKFIETLGLLLMIVVVGWIAHDVAKSALRKPVAVGIDRCPLDPGAIKRSIIVVVDNTSPLSPLARDRLVARLEGTMRVMEPDERLTVFQIRGEAAVTAQPFLVDGQPISFCRGQDAGGQSAETDRRRLLARAIDREVTRPLLAGLEKVATEPPAQWSPVIEALAALFLTPEYRSAASIRQIWIFSSLIQHSQELSELRSAELDACAMSKSGAGRALRERMVYDTTIDIFYQHSSRSAARQGEAHLSRWAQFFAISGIRYVAKDGKQLPIDVTCSDDRGGSFGIRGERGLTARSSWSLTAPTKGDRPK
jgi:hypothetical protein